jgi:hypothetical protein
LVVHEVLKKGNEWTHRIFGVVAQTGAEQRIHDEYVVLLQKDHLGTRIVASSHLVGQLARLAVVVHIVLRHTYHSPTISQP